MPERALFFETWGRIRFSMLPKSRETRAWKLMRCRRDVLVTACSLAVPALFVVASFQVASTLRDREGSLAGNPPERLTTSAPPARPSLDSLPARALDLMVGMLDSVLGELAAEAEQDPKSIDGDGADGLAKEEPEPEPENPENLYEADAGEEVDVLGGAANDGPDADEPPDFREGPTLNDGSTPLVLWVFGPGDDEPLGPGDDEPLGPGDDEPLGPGDDEPLGPDDDEPLLPECADWDGVLEISLQTNFTHPAYVLITSKGRYVTSRRFDGDGGGGASVDPDSGLLEAPLSLDLVRLGTDLSLPDLVTPEGGVVDLQFTLHSHPEGTLLGTVDWRGTVDGRPWLELLPVLPGLGEEAERFHEDMPDEELPADFLLGPFPENDSSEPQKVRVELHTPRWDSFLVLLGAETPSDLDASPEDDGFLQGSTLLHVGNRRPGESDEIVHFVDSPTSGDTTSSNGAPRYLALWTFHHLRGWCRSAVYAVP